MTDDLKTIIRYVCEGDIGKAQEQARIILRNCETKKDINFKMQMLKKLDNTPFKLMELPANLKNILIAEDVSNFRDDRFLLREGEKSIVDKILNTYGVATRLSELGVRYLPSAVFHGPSGTGKTMLARYVAYRSGLPFVYVQFSALIGSLLGETGKNLNRIFNYAKQNPCVLCIDEIDAIGIKRGAGGDGGGPNSEMSRVVIGLMQELDQCPNSVLLIATTNRHDMLDDALLNRFSLQHEVKPFCMEDIITTTGMFFDSIGCGMDEPVDVWCRKEFQEGVSTRQIMRTCTEQLVDWMLAHPDAEI